MILPLLFGFSIDSSIKLFIDADLSNYFDFTDIKIDNIIDSYGIYSNEDVLIPLEKMLNIKI